MSLLADLVSLLDSLHIPVETGSFSGVPPDEYAVLTPLSDTYMQFADDLPHFEIQEVRISLFSKGNHSARKAALANALLQAGLTVTDRRSLGLEPDTQYHHLAMDVAKLQDLKEE